jgi:predicted hotdog family 3-hydroxylacyl-ACP dehydratase
MHIAVEHLIPHRPPMRFIEALTACGENTATAMVRFDAGDFPVADGCVLETALVECVSQTVAAAFGHRGGGKTGGADKGMLVAVSNFKIHSQPAVGRDLRIEIQELKRLGPMLLIGGAVSCEGQAIASGELSLYA